MSAPSRAPATGQPRARSRGGGALAGVLALTALAAALRFPTLSTQSYWLDESVTAYLVHLPFGHMLSQIPRTESTPPLYYASRGCGRSCSASTRRGCARSRP